MRTLASFAVAAGKVRVAAGARSRLSERAALSITAAAAERLKELLHSKPDAIGIRIGVKERGCNGVSYTMNYVTSDAPPPVSHTSVKDKGVCVYIEPNALLKVVGTTMDWQDTGVARAFVFNNPNAKGVCGCGESFTV